MNLLLTNLYLFILATIFALLEIQIEGDSGWAKNLPTWKPSPNLPFAKFYSKIMSGKELTGYHLVIFSLVFLIFHFPYFFGVTLTLNNYLETLSLYFMFVVLWDFLWFVLNPNYPLAKFRKGLIEWHKKWLLFAPTDYFIFLALSFLIILPIKQLEWWFINIALFLIWTVLVAFFSQFILKIDSWKS